MKTRVSLRSPFGAAVVRDIVDGLWQEPSGDSETTIGSGLWALPGLVDAHAHLAAVALTYQPGDLDGAIGRAAAAVEAGVMLVLDKGWTDETAMRVAEQVPSGDRPDIDAAAHILAVSGGYYPDFAREIDPESISVAAGEEANLGLGWVKLIGDWPRRGQGPIGNFTEAQLVLAVEAAERAGSRVAIHTMARDVPSAAVAAGVHSIEHGLFLTEDDIGELGRRSGMWVPTVLRIDETIAQLGSESSGGRLLVEGLSNVERLLPLAVEAGVQVLPGTDLIGAPADVAEEAIRMQAAGLTARQVVEAVGRTGFVATGRPADFELGSPANAVLFSEDPTSDLGVLRHPAAVIREGRLL